MQENDPTWPIVAGRTALILVRTVDRTLWWACRRSLRQKQATGDNLTITHMTRAITAAASQGLAAGRLLADRQVRHEASPAHRSADHGPPTSAPRWSDAITINTRASVRPGMAPCLRTNGTEKL